MDEIRIEAVPAAQNSIRGYSRHEAVLIRELVKSRLEQRAGLEYENLDGYELPPRSQFSMLKKPSVSIKYRQMTFNMASIRLFEGVRYILPIYNPEKHRMAVVTCAEEEAASVEWARPKDDIWVNKTITSEEFISKLYVYNEWDIHCRYKVLGRVANSSSGLILVFDLPEAIMFAAQPIEYVDPGTGEVKKRHIKYYPDTYKDCIGKSYNDYAATRQLNLFEDLNECSGDESRYDTLRSESGVQGGGPLE